MSVCLRLLAAFLLIALPQAAIPLSLLPDAFVERQDPFSDAKVTCVHGTLEKADAIGMGYFWWALCDSVVSGYAAFGADFERLTPEETERIRAWLAQNYRPERFVCSHLRRRLNTASASARKSIERRLEALQNRGQCWLELLQRLDGLYAQRKTTPEFQLILVEKLVAAAETAGRMQLARDYSRRAIGMLQQRLQALESGATGRPQDFHLDLVQSVVSGGERLRFRRLEAETLLGRFHLVLGEHRAACRYLYRVWTADTFDRDGHVIVGLDSFRSTVISLESELPRRYRFIDRLARSEAAPAECR